MSHLTIGLVLATHSTGPGFTARAFFVVACGRTILAERTRFVGKLKCIVSVGVIPTQFPLLLLLLLWLLASAWASLPVSLLLRLVLACASLVVPSFLLLLLLWPLSTA